ESVRYEFSNAPGGKVWDVTADETPVLKSTDLGSGRISVELQSKDDRLRKFITFSESSLLVPSIGRIAAPQLRDGICQKGAQDLIVASRAFQQAAEKLRDLRRKGGEATEAMTAEIVYIEDIQNEFGYGSVDPTGLRDFIAYTFRHATDKPVFLTLLG